MLNQISVMTATAYEQFTYLLWFLGGLGCFLIGFKLLSDNIENLCGRQMRVLFNKTGKNKLIGLGVGAAATAAVQSSSATTVMVVGFVNAGIMTLMQATPIIMGANIGTTITALIMAFGGASIKIFFIAMIGVGGFFVLFGSNHKKLKLTGFVLAGLGLLFLGMDLMSDYMKEFLTNNEVAMNFIQGLSNPFVLLLLGMVLTALVQSSAAVTVLVMSVSAYMNVGNSLLFLILGTNIGTCVTALLSSIGTSTNARRASVIHLMFNVLGSVIFFIFLVCYQNFKEQCLASWLEDPNMQIAVFHFLFNVICAMIFLPFSNLFVKASMFLVRDRKQKKKKATIATMLDDRLLKNPSVALTVVNTEVLHMGQMAMTCLNSSMDCFYKKDINDTEKIQKQIANVEELNNEILDYLLKIASADGNTRDDASISKFHRILINLERVATISDNILKYAKHEVDDGLVFSDKVEVEIKGLMDMLNRQFDNITKLFADHRDQVIYGHVVELENDIDNTRTSLINGHIKRLEEGKCSPNSNTVFISLVSNLERVGDHLDYVAHTFVAEEN